MDYIGITEIQSAHAKHIDKGVHEAKEIRSENQGAAASCGHNHWVMQRIADCYTAIKGHGREEKTFSGSQENKEIHLGEAVHVGNVLGGCQ